MTKTQQLTLQQWVSLTRSNRDVSEKNPALAGFFCCAGSSMLSVRIFQKAKSECCSN